MPSTSASRRPSVLYGLLWKESMQLLPLLLALLGLSAFLFVVLSLIPDGYRAFPTFLILIPNIFALGAPPMAIGQEDETGTLRWTRGLPIGWRSIVLVKTIVALVGLVLVWLSLTGMVALAGPVDLFGGSEVFSVEAIGGVGFAFAFSLYLLSGGFAISWWLRSPIASLLTLLPVITVLFVIIMQIATQLAGPHGYSPIVHAISLFASAVLLMAVAVAVAWRTLCRPWVRRRTRRWNAASSAIHSAYQPVSIVPLHSPGRYAALLWQAFSQTWLVVFPLFCIGIISAAIALVSVTDGQGQLPAVSLMLGLLVTSFLGAMVFVTENKNRRHRFLADRGIGAFTIWWTRQAMPLAAALVLAGIFFGIHVLREYGPRESGLTGLQTLLLFANAFACGQLTGQAFRRPIVGMLAAPVAFAASNMFAFAILTLYPSYNWAGIGAVVLLWLVTLLLCRRWSEEGIDAGYYGRLAGWIGLATLIFVGTIAAVRYATTPPAIPGWHEETLAFAERTVAVEGSGSYSSLLAADLPTRQDSPSGERLYTVDELREAAEDVIEDERVVLGHHARADAARILEMLRAEVRKNAPHISERDAASSLTDGNHSAANAYQAWLEAMLLSSRRTYEGASSRWDQPLAGERLEAMAIDELLRPDSRELLGVPAWEQLVALVPTSAERTRWWKNHLLRGWLEYQHNPLYVPFLPVSYSAGLRRSIPAEQWRTGRLLDRAVRVSLSQLAEGVPPTGSPQEAKRLQAWQALLDDILVGVDPSFRPGAVLPTSEWSRDLEQKAERLREMAR